MGPVQKWSMMATAQWLAMVLISVGIIAAGSRVGIRANAFWILAPLLVPVLGAILVVLYSTNGLVASQWRGIYTLNGMTFWCVMAAWIFMLLGILLRALGRPQHEDAFLSSSVAMASAACLSFALYWCLNVAGAFARRCSNESVWSEAKDALKRATQIEYALMALWLLTCVCLSYYFVYGVLIVIPVNAACMIGILAYRAMRNV